MNIRQGLRRISTVILIVVNLWFLLLYIFSGLIFWDIDYISQAKVINLSNKQQIIDLIDFSQQYFEDERSINEYNASYYFKSLGFKINPYKRYFKNWDGFIFKDNDIIELPHLSKSDKYHLSKKEYNLISTEGLLFLKDKKVRYIVKLPSSFLYFITQLWQFLLIPLFDIIIVLLYLLFEFITCWIIKGFNE